MSLAEVVATGLTSWLALVIALAYLADALGVWLPPAVVGLVTAGLVAVALGGSFRKSTRNLVELAAWLLVVTSFLGWLLWLGWPELLPPGRGPDLTHHLLLVDYIERHHQTPLGLGLEAAMGEMAHYTPGLHLLTVLAGTWMGSDGFRAIYSVVCVSAALTIGFVFLIALRVLPAGRSRLPLALAGVLLVVGARAYVADAFVHESFLAQAVSALFAVAVWWAIAAWDESPSALAATIAAANAIGVFLVWPVWIGPPLLTFVVLVLTREGLRGSSRLTALLTTLTPIAIVAGVHVAGSARWAQLVRSSGAALRPSIALVGWLLPALALAGLVAAVRERRARSTLLMLGAIVLQAVVLYVMATSNGADTPYMALKMVYLAVYPLGVLASLGLFSLVRAVEHPARAMLAPRDGATALEWRRGREGGPFVLSGIVLVVIAILTSRSLASTAPPVPVVSRELYHAGQWVRANVGTTCVDYLVEDRQTAYWLHLAVLGNPRASQRSAETDRHTMRDAFARWIPAEGLPYAIADLRLLPSEIRSRVEIVRQFGDAGVIKRPGASACAEQ